jgi:hypothetical protein
MVAVGRAVSVRRGLERMDKYPMKPLYTIYVYRVLNAVNRTAFGESRRPGFRKPIFQVAAERSAKAAALLVV